MKRPTRIMVFGILCLIMGGLSGLDNLGAVQLAVLGPAGVQTEMGGVGGEWGEMIEEVVRATQSALGKPVYRWLFGLEAVLGVVMAGVLVTAGIGLLRDQLWAIRLTRIWGFFALGSAVLTVVLQVRFVMSGISSMPPGAGVLAMSCMLPLLWAFPILLLTLLGRPVVIDYLRWRAAQGSGHGQMPSRPVAQTTETYASNAPERRATTPPPAPPRSPVPDSWRDDPWNDPNSQ